MLDLLTGLLAWTQLAGVGPPAGGVSVPAWDQLVVRDSWSIEAGLPQCSVSSVLQTRDGFLWAGTSGGLARFDGEQFRSFGPNTSGLEASRILSLFESSSGDLWVGTQRGGLVHYRAGAFTRVSTEADASIGPTYCLEEDLSGDLWVGGHGLYRLAGARADGVLKRELDPLLSAVKVVHGLLVNAAGDLVVATDAGLFRRQGGRFELLIEDQPQDFRGLVEDAEGRVWGFGGRSELFVLDRTLTRFAKGPEELPQAPGGRFIRGAALGPEGFILLVGDDKLWELHPEVVPGGIVGVELEPVADLRGMGMGSAVCTDREGLVWVGSGSRGLACLEREPFRVLTSGQSEPRAFWALFPAADEGLVARSMDGELFRARSDLSFAPLPWDRQVPSLAVMDTRGSWWQASGSTLLQFDAAGAPLEQVELELPNMERLSFGEDGALWIGCSEVVARYLDGQLEILPFTARGPVHQVLDGGEHGLWLLSKEALLHWDGATLTHFGGDEGVPNIELRALHMEPDGELWMTTYGAGLVRIRGARVDCYGMRDGLLDDHLGGMLSAGSGRFYVNSNRGVLALARGDVDAFDRGELPELPCRLLPTGEGNSSMSCATPDGLLWFPTMNGLAVVDPARDTDTPQRPQVVLEGVSVDGRPQELTGALDLPPGDGNLEFRYVAPSFRGSGGVRYRYRLEGYDEEWTEVGPSRTAVYRGLQPADYRFRVTAKNGAGGWGDELSIAVRLRPRFYQHWWFPIPVAAGLLLLAYLLHWTRMRTLREHSLALQTEIRERRAAEEERQRAEEQLRESTKLEAVGRLAGGIAHDFHNVLTVIQGNAELLRSRAELLSPRDILTHVDAIDSCSAKAASLTKQLLAFSRRQVLRPRVIDVNAIVLGLEKLLTHLLPPAIELRIQTSPETGFVIADPSQLEQVVMNLVLNGRDAMPQGGKLLVQTRREGVVVDGEVLQHAVIAVEDSGSGIHADDLPHIFEPFFTTKGPGGTGLGLASVHGIVIQSGGQVTVESQPNAGACFKVLLPSVEGAAAAAARLPELSGELRGTETILICDDYDPVRSVTRRTLEEYGYSVLVADHPERALEIARRGTGLAMLITDFAMPGMSGRELAARMLLEYPELRVLFLSGYAVNVARQSSAVAGEASAEFEFLRKPFTPEQLASRVRQVLDSRTGGAIPT